MKTLLKITVAVAVIIFGLVGVKIGYYEYTHRDGYASATTSANKVTAVHTTEYKTKPPETVATTVMQTTAPVTAAAPTEAPKPTLPGITAEVVTYLENSLGTPVGSTIEKPDLSDSVFIGDSVSLGFSRYCAKKGLMSDTVFLTAGSYSVKNALSDNMSSNKGYRHPMYKGKETPVAKAIADIKPKNVFICLGINDVAITGVDGTVNNYCKLISKIRNEVPDSTVYVVSTTFLVQQAQKKNLNNHNLASLNHNMKKICEETDKLEYIDIMSALQDENNALKAEYCSDEYIHQTDAAYAIWAQRLGATQ